MFTCIICVMYCTVILVFKYRIHLEINVKRPAKLNVGTCRYKLGIVCKWIRY